VGKQGVWAPVGMIPMVAIGRLPVEALEGQQVGVGDEREAPALHDVSAHGVVGSCVVHFSGVLLAQGVKVEFVAQLFLTEHSGNEVLPEILTHNFTFDQIDDLGKQFARRTPLHEGNQSPTCSIGT
jgi:hypothetical protein